jgi:hypothetical protein
MAKDDAQWTRLFKYLDRCFADVDKRFQQMDERFNAIYNLLDDRIKHEDIENSERAAMTSQLNRHDGWIHQLADKTHTNLL